MKTAIRSLAAALALTALALPLAAAQTLPDAASAASFDASGAYYLLHHPRALARFLGLSPAQTATLLGLDKTLEQTVQPLRQARGPLCQALVADLGGAPDPATVGAATIALADNRQAIIAARQTFDDAFSAILTPAQLVAYDTLKQIASAIDEDFSPIGQCPRN